MLPVAEGMEEASFDVRVRQRGARFLARTPNPTVGEWERASYWREVIPDLRKKYSNICSYTSFIIPIRSGDATVDHFQSRKTHPNLAYEWRNFRFSSRRANEWKGIKTVVDPFTLRADSFVLNLDTFRVGPNPALESELIREIDRSITILHLNDDIYIDTRSEFIATWKEGMIDDDILKKEAPFIAYELRRQGVMKV